VAALLGQRQKIEQTPDDELPAAADAATEPLLFYSLDHVDIARLLISKGVDVNATSRFGKTALMNAAQWNLLDVARLPIASHAEVNAATMPASDQSCNPIPRIAGRTALMYVAENAAAPMIEALPGGRCGPACEGPRGSRCGLASCAKHAARAGGARSAEPGAVGGEVTTLRW
jgi:hypothetical protein